jgi:hypothetical protein
MTSFQQLIATLKKGRIYWIKGDWPYPASDGRGHHFIILNNEPDIDQILVLAHGSRQIDKARYRVALKEEHIDTLVIIEANKYPIWKEETVINCNDVISADLIKLSEALENNNLAVSEVELDADDMSRVIKGVLLSESVSQVHKTPLY